MTMPALLLQKPSRKSKTKEHVAYLDKRLKWWQDGQLDLLVREGAAIQKKLAKCKVSADHSEKVFVRLILQGKVSSAMRWIGSQSTTVLPADPRVMMNSNDFILKDLLHLQAPSYMARCRR